MKEINSLPNFLERTPLINWEGTRDATGNGVGLYNSFFNVGAAIGFGGLAFADEFYNHIHQQIFLIYL